MQEVRSSTLAVAAFLAAALGLSAGFLGPRVASAAPPPGHEYNVLLLEFEQYKEEPEYKDLEKRLGSPWQAQFAYQQLVLSKAGEAGWELVAVVTHKSPATSVLYLKKPRS